MEIPFRFCGRQIGNQFRQSAVVEPTDPFHSSTFCCFKVAPRRPSVDHLNLVKTVDGFCRSVINKHALDLCSEQPVRPASPRQPGRVRTLCRVAMIDGKSNRRHFAAWRGPVFLPMIIDKRDRRLFERSSSAKQANRGQIHRRLAQCLSVQVFFCCQSCKASALVRIGSIASSAVARSTFSSSSTF